MMLLLLLAAPDADFEKRVRPLLAEHCHACHGPKKAMAGLRLDTRAGLLKGGDGGAVVAPGRPEKSRLIQAVRHSGDLKMPKEKLREEDINVLAAWVEAGAPWPEEKTVDAEAWKRHWAFQPLKRPPVPGGEGRNPIDRFRRKKTPEVDAAVLRRRTAFALTGLPPDDRIESHERQVERLLASPRYGERWARRWLDLARYADTKGYVFFEEAAYPWGWTYRDWVIEAFNEDVPYDRFLKLQLAADTLPGATRKDLRALGFLVLGGRFMNNTHDILDDRIDVATRATMGLAVTCARCHDHKFDPIPTTDYYALYGVFASCAEPGIAPAVEDAPKEFADELARREKKLADFLAGKRKALAESARTRAAEYLVAAHARRGLPRADEFMLIADPGDLNPSMVTRWQAAMDARKADPAWKAWHTATKETIKGVAERLAKLPTPAEVTPELFSELQLLPDRASQGVLQSHRKPVEEWRAKGKGAPPRANILRDKALHDPVVFKRGNPSLPGEKVPRRFLTLFGGKEFKHGSGRLELAEGIVAAPVTARVMANRVWMHLMGTALVGTPGDFGLRADAPTHPALLEWLACELVESGWSVKRLCRLIATSAAFRQRGLMRRLELEELRDALLVAGGNLDSMIGGPSVTGEMGAGARRRTLYSHVDRIQVQGLFR
ncbi:MAG: PSD1 and planctomycete cytochrome C domain-containing protein, partial [Gemmataceae bacterium]|nr:PSD1 and planctomycete cytochrome C domain-containing protein [Gemmataceae bacterium]